MAGQSNHDPIEQAKGFPEEVTAELVDTLRNVVHEQVLGMDAPDESVFDVFISHTMEDKADVVRPLATALRDAGLRVWYDEFELKIGDSLRRKIDRGLAASRFGVVVLSQAFFGRRWPEYELDGLVPQTVSGLQGLRGTVRSGIRVIPAEALRPLSLKVRNRAVSMMLTYSGLLGPYWSEG